MQIPDIQALTQQIHARVFGQAKEQYTEVLEAIRHNARTLIYQHPTPRQSGALLASLQMTTKEDTQAGSLSLGVTMERQGVFTDSGLGRGYPLSAHGRREARRKRFYSGELDKSALLASTQAALGQEYRKLFEGLSVVLRVEAKG